jgi:hypothetical protein
MEEHFKQLITNFCAAVNLAKPEDLIKGAGFAAGDVTFSLRYDRAAPETLLIFTDFGAVPESGRSLILYTLLEENFITAIGSTGTFGLSSKTNNIVYIKQVKLDQLTPETLFKTIVSLADQAREWRETHYIHDAPEPEPEARARGIESLRLNTGEKPNCRLGM